MTLLERIRIQFKRTLRLRSRPDDAGVDEAELRERIAKSEAMLATLQTAGWKHYEEEAAALAEQLKENWLSLKPEELNAAKAVQAQGIALGCRLTLNVAATIINRGVEAERKLDALRPPARNRVEARVQ